MPLPLLVDLCLEDLRMAIKMEGITIEVVMEKLGHSAPALVMLLLGRLYLQRVMLLPLRLIALLLVVLFQLA